MADDRGGAPPREPIEPERHDERRHDMERPERVPPEDVEPAKPGKSPAPPQPP